MITIYYHYPLFHIIITIPLYLIINLLPYFNYPCSAFTISTSLSLFFKHTCVYYSFCNSLAFCLFKISLAPILIDFISSNFLLTFITVFTHFITMLLPQFSFFSSCTPVKVSSNTNSPSSSPLYSKWCDVALAEPGDNCTEGVTKCKPGYECNQEICTAPGKYISCFILPARFLSIQLQEQRKYNCCYLCRIWIWNAVLY